MACSIPGVRCQLDIDEHTELSRPLMVASPRRLEALYLSERHTTSQHGALLWLMVQLHIPQTGDAHAAHEGKMESQRTPVW